MTLASLLVQMANGLASASSLFLVAAGLSLIFGVTRIVNFAHGSFYVLGLYLAWSLVEWFGRTSVLGFWGGIALAALIVGVLGALVEMTILRRIYRAPELFQLLATFALVLIVRDALLAIWGAENLLGPRAPGLGSGVEILGRRLPAYDIFLICFGPLVLLLLWLLLTRTRFGRLIRAATQDREMVAALGVNQAWLFTGVFALGCALAGLGGALQLPREPASLLLDTAIIAEAFVVVVVGGLGSLPGAFLAALLIAEAKALCIALGDQSVFGFTISFPRLTLVIEFLIMALVLAVRPHGLLGRPVAQARGVGERPVAPQILRLRWLLLGGLLLAATPLFADRYTVVLLTDIVLFALFAASLQFLMGPGGMTSFGHAAFLGIGAYAAALLLKASVPMPLALVLAVPVGALFALVIGWFCVRLSGVYLAMLTLAFAQIIWSITFQWDAVTGGSNGLIGLWPAPFLADKTRYFWLALACALGGIALLWRLAGSPFGLALRAGRDAPMRATASGVDVPRQQWLAFAVVGAVAALAGSLYAFSKGSISPDVLGIPRSVDALVAVLLGGVHAMVGPILGSALFVWAQDELVRGTDYWRALLGALILVIVLVLPGGLASLFRRTA